MEIPTGLAAAVAGAIPCLLFGAVAALIVVAVIWGMKKARERREALARLAAEWGIRFYADDPWDLAARYGGFDLFNSGHSRRASNILAGDIGGRPVVMCDYQYKTGSGKNESTHTFQAAVLEMPIVAPRLQMRRENVLDRIAEWVGHGDLNFESEEFSRRYHVKCEEPKFAYDILHERLIEYLLGCGEAPTLAMSGPLMVLAFDGTGTADVFRRLLGIGEHIIGSIPDYVLTARGTAAAKGAGDAPPTGRSHSAGDAPA